MAGEAAEDLAAGGWTGSSSHTLPAPQSGHTRPWSPGLRHSHRLSPSPYGTSSRHYATPWRLGCSCPKSTRLPTSHHALPGKEKEPWVRSTRRARSRASVSPARRWPSSTWRRTGFPTAESCPMAPECPRKRFCRRSRAPASPASSGSWMGLRGPAVSSWPAASSGRCWGPCGPARLQDASPRHQGRERPYRPHHSDLRLIAFWSGRCSRTPSTRTSWDPSISSRVDPLPWQVSSRLVSGDPAAWRGLWRYSLWARWGDRQGPSFLQAMGLFRGSTSH